MHKLEVIYSGDIVDKPTKMVTLAIVKGFLSAVSETEVNYVNATLRLKEFGVELVESKSSQLEKYTNLITVKFTGRPMQFPYQEQFLPKMPYVLLTSSDTNLTLNPQHM